MGPRVLDGAYAKVRLLAWSKTALRFGHLANITILALACFSVLKASPHQLDTISYNFMLAGGGGGSAAKLDKSLDIEIFCVDFANEIIVPKTNYYSANLTSITSSGFNATTTRFGSNTSWRTVTIADDAVDGGSDDVVDSGIINGATNALGRYQMAAYLVSQYNRPAGNNTANNGIQTAIWKILNPSIYSAAPVSADASAALEQAAVWYNTTITADRDSYLANYRIVSDSTMTACGLVLCGGFQEQITVVPEPKYVGLLLMGLFALFSIRLRKASMRTPA
jgi:hypothetical protein